MDQNKKKQQKNSRHQNQENTKENNQTKAENNVHLVDLDGEFWPQNVARNIEHLYYTENNIDKILENLDTLRLQMYPKKDEQKADSLSDTFPSVCLIGLGRCGSNIALEVATLVYNARNFYLKELFKEEEAKNETENLPLHWIRRNLKLKEENSKKPVFLIEPIVMMGDLDKDLLGRINFSTKADGKENNFLRDYTKLKLMDLSEVHAGGAGNSPILGQYLAKIILNKNTDHFSNDQWKYIHSYLIDSCGIKANQSRLYFYIFSAGGGTGSGTASEFGLAQQYSYMNKTFEIKNQELEDKQESTKSKSAFIFEPIFTSGICILPNITGYNQEISEALHINAGRLLCKYLSEEWNFSYNYDLEEDTESIVKRIRPWNSMMLISNDIMRYAEISEYGAFQDVDVSAMEKYANQYVSQQIFNILTAQSVTSDYDENYFRRAGINIGETIRLDANDLYMSLAGPVAIAYAESVVYEANAKEKKLDPTVESNIDIDDLFFRSIDLPHFNKKTKAIEGISLLPIEATNYKETLKDYKESGMDATRLNHLHFYNNCSSIVTIISLPKDFKLSYMDLNRLKTHIHNLFPNTTLKRYALVIGASANLSLTTLISKSPCLSDDILTLLVSYIKRCLAKEKYRYDDSIDKLILNIIKEDVIDEKVIDDFLNDFENPAKVLDTNWFGIKPMYEKKYKELISDPKKFIGINEIRLSKEHVKKAIYYLHEIYRHRVSKTKIVSLS